MKIENAKCYRFSKSDWLKIAIAIDSDFKGQEVNFEITMPTKVFPKSVCLSSSKCDRLPTIYVHSKNLQGIQKIEYEGEFTDGKQEIQPFTYLKIEKAFK